MGGIMTVKTLTVALLLALAGCAGGPAVLNQAQAVPVQPAPLSPFPQPRHTPAGAGASPLGMPWQAPAQVERSPNKRVLPVDPTDPAPGLWAADEVKGSTTKYPSVADVELPLPASDDSNLEGPSCAYKINRLLRSEGQMKQLMELSLHTHVETHARASAAPRRFGTLSQASGTSRTRIRGDEPSMAGILP